MGKKQKIKKCLTCNNYDKQEKKCKENKDCNKTDFSKCDSYLINEKLIHF